MEREREREGERERERERERLKVPRTKLVWKSPREGWNLLLPRSFSSPNSEFHHIDSGLPSLQTSISIYKEGPIYKLPADSPACGVWLDVPAIEYILMVIGPEDFNWNGNASIFNLRPLWPNQKTQHFLSSVPFFLSTLFSFLLPSPSVHLLDSIKRNGISLNKRRVFRYAALVRPPFLRHSFRARVTLMLRKISGKRLLCNVVRH